MKTAQTIEKDLQIVGFRIGRETFGLPIGAVREIVRVPEITSVPNSPDFIEGVINLRGRIIPVVDLRKRFGEPVGAPSKKNRIVVVEVENRSLGLMVNSASEVLKIPPSEIEEPHAVFQEGDLNYITGVGKLNGRLVILLDLSKVLQRGELKRIAETEDGGGLIAAEKSATGTNTASSTTQATQGTQATQKKGSKPAPGKQNGALVSK
jgi:purine-binding chemotaxis protein CheW